MFEHLSTSRSVDPEQLHSLANEAARKFLAKHAADRVPLNDSILKMARDNGLNSHCIERVCEWANTAVDRSLFETFQKVAAQVPGELFYPKFPPAEAASIIRALGVSEKTASVQAHVDDYDRPVDHRLSAGYDASLDHGLEKVAREMNPVSPADYERLWFRLETLAENLKMEKAASGIAIDDSADKAYQYIKQRVLKGESLKSMFKASLNRYSDQGKKDRVKEIFQTAAQRLVDDGVAITQDRQGAKLAYPGIAKEDVDQWVTDCWEPPQGAGGVLVLNGSYVNDSSPLFSQLDVLIRQYDDGARYDRALIVVDDKFKYLKSKMRGLQEGGA